MPTNNTAPRVISVIVGDTRDERNRPPQRGDFRIFTDAEGMECIGMVRYLQHTMTVTECSHGTTHGYASFCGNESRSGHFFGPTIDSEERFDGFVCYRANHMGRHLEQFVL